jgi:arylformamidase
MSPIYRDFDRASLDAAYNNRAHVPGFAASVERWAADSARVRATAPGARLDRRYGAGPRQLLDFFPAAAPDAPCLLFFHGGYWQSLDKSLFSFLAPTFTSMGVACAVVGYDLCPDVDLPTLVDEAREAVLWLRRAASGLGVDAARLFVAGHSAGGHLAARLAHTDWRRLGEPEPPLAGALALSGLYDLEPIRLCYLNDKLGLTPAVARTESPLHAILPSAPPLILACGAAELPEFPRQQAEYAAALATAGAPAHAVILSSGDNHFSVVDRFADKRSSLFRLAHRVWGLNGR